MKLAIPPCKNESTLTGFTGYALADKLGYSDLIKEFRAILENTEIKTLNESEIFAHNAQRTLLDRLARKIENAPLQ